MEYDSAMVNGLYIKTAVVRKGCAVDVRNKNVKMRAGAGVLYVGGGG